MFSMILIIIIFFDLSSHRIPNILIAALMILSFICRGFHCVIPFVSALILFFPFFCLRMFGAGDIKLIAASVGFLGFQRGGTCIFIAFLTAAVISLAKLMMSKSLLSRISYFLSYFRQLFQVKKPLPYYDAARDGYEHTLPFSLPLGIAYFLLNLISLAGGAG